ncbi:MAG: PPOX class F420-dependent oxidoreductase [Nocardioidaceae bacterium]
MDIDDAREFVRRHHRAVLATRTPEDGLQQSPILASVDAEGRFVVSTPRASVKARNLRRDPRAQLCVFTDAFFGPWVYVTGRAEVVALPEAMELLVDYYRSVSGEHDDWDDYRASMRAEDRVLVRIDADHVGPG